MKKETSHGEESSQDKHRPLLSKSLLALVLAGN